MGSFAEVLQLDARSITALSSLIGSTPYRILTPCLQVAGQHYTSPSLSLETGSKDYIAISCEWFETPYSRADYWRIVISETNAPTSIEVRSDGALVAPCTINLYGAELISSIEIHSSRWDWSDKGDREHVEYDSALVFRMSGEPRFCIWCQLNGPGIATEVHYTENRELIDEILRYIQVRIRLD
jgi:hypothetical protein